MDETPWPDTLKHGANELCRLGIGPIPHAVLRALTKSYATSPWPQPLGDGNTGLNIQRALADRFAGD